MIRGKEWLHQEGQMPQERLLSANPPIVNNVGPWAVLRKGPDATSDKISPRLQRKSVRRIVFKHSELPAQGVRKPALGLETYDFAFSVFSPFAHFLNIEVDGRPPAGKSGSVRDHIKNFLFFAFNTPMSYKMIFIAKHSPKTVILNQLV